MILHGVHTWYYLYGLLHMTTLLMSARDVQACWECVENDVCEAVNFVAS